MALPATVEDGGCWTNDRILGTPGRLVRLNVALDVPAAFAVTLYAPAVEFAVGFAKWQSRLTR